MEIKKPKIPMQTPQPLSMPWKKHPVKVRIRWAEQGSRELSKRLGVRLGISTKDAADILRVVGQEAGNMATEGWVFSLPHFAIFWTHITNIVKSHLPGYEGQMLGGNQRMNMTESKTLITKFKEKKNETNSIKNTEQDA